MNDNRIYDQEYDVEYETSYLSLNDLFTFIASIKNMIMCILVQI